MSCIFEIFKIFTGMGLALHFATCGASGGTPKSALDGLCRDGSIVGAVGLVALDGRVVSLETAGYADSESKTPMSADTIFWIASQTKPITAAAVMILVDEGRLSLDTPIARIVPELKNMRLRDGTVVPDSEITVRALLSHTAGFPEMPTDSPDFKADATPLAEQMRVFSALPLEFRAGEKYLYSNVGINIAGRIVEVVSGEPYGKFVEARILEPLGMSDTSFVPSSADLPRIASAYRFDESAGAFIKTQINVLSYPLDSPTRKPIPAGGLFSTARDMLKFCRMLAQGGEYDGVRILSERAVSEMRRRQTGAGLEQSYGLCLFTTRDFYGHGGMFGTEMANSADGRITVIYMVQKAGHFPKDGDKGAEIFRAAAVRTLAKSLQNKLPKQ